MSVPARHKELIAKHLLSNQKLIPKFIKAKRWNELICLQTYADADAPISLIGSDSALYITLRAQITKYRIKWNFNLQKLKKLASKTKPK